MNQIHVSMLFTCDDFKYFNLNFDIRLPFYFIPTPDTVLSCIQKVRHPSASQSLHSGFVTVVIYHPYHGQDAHRFGCFKFVIM